MCVRLKENNLAASPHKISLMKKSFVETIFAKKYLDRPPSKWMEKLEEQAHHKN